MHPTEMFSYCMFILVHSATTVSVLLASEIFSHIFVFSYHKVDYEHKKLHNYVSNALIMMRQEIKINFERLIYYPIVMFCFYLFAIITPFHEEYK